MKDAVGVTMRVGDRVARAYTSGRSAQLEIVNITRIDENGVFLDGRKVPIRYGDRCVILT